ncbi:hypothetical protein PM082_018516 [Marasmius tenuissimus]|nr:hypothetical protein PM082_018516 [Marasmius tenuissimus]
MAPEHLQTGSSRSQWSFKGILTDTHLKLLSSIGPISSLGHLKNLLGQWIWWERYGNELWGKCISTLEIPPFKKKVKENSKSVAGEKRKGSERGEEELNTLETPSQKCAKMSSSSNQNIPPLRTPTTMNTRPLQEQMTASASYYPVSHSTSSSHSQPYPITPVFPTTASVGPSSTPHRDPFRVLSAYPTPNPSPHYTAPPGPDTLQPYRIPTSSISPCEQFSSPVYMSSPTDLNSSSRHEHLTQNGPHPNSSQQQIH